MVKKMVLENLNGQMGLPMMANSLTIISMVWVSTYGQMIDAMKGSGRTTKCMAMDYLPGQT